MERDITSYRFLKKIYSLPFVQAVYLFGSRAQGTNRERSDIDLAIDCTGATKAQWYNILEIIEENDDTLLSIDCIRLDTVQDEKFLQMINNNKILLYQKGAP